jgi:phosphoribosylformylglycinamidine cyclo-ligase
LLENIPRILPAGTGVQIQRHSWPVLPIFEAMQRIGNIEEAEMYRTFNLGIGMVVVCAESDAARITAHVDSCGDACYEIGRVTQGDKSVAIV